jgi:hypothetical protein
MGTSSLFREERVDGGNAKSEHENEAQPERQGRFPDPQSQNDGEDKKSDDNFLRKDCQSASRIGWLKINAAPNASQSRVRMPNAE